MRRTILLPAILLWVASAAAGADPEPRAIRLSSASPEAIAAFERGRDLFESSREFEARGFFEKAIALDPQFAFAHAMLAQCLDGEAATKQMDRAASLGAALDPAGRAMLQFWHARQAGDDAEAEKSVTLLEELAPDDWRIELLLGERAVEEGKGEEAVRLFRRAVELNPEAGEAYNHLGFALSDLGQHDAAITALRRYAALKRDDPNPSDSLGEILLRAGRLEDAEGSFRKASANPQFWYAAAGVATARLFRGEFERGREALREEVAVAPDAAVRVRLMTFAAWTLLAENRRTEGLAALDAAEQVARASKLPALHAQLATTRAAFHVLAGEPAAALPLLDAALERTSGKKLSGADQVSLRRSVAGWRIRAFVLLGRTAEAKGALESLQAEAAGNRGLTALVRGLRPAVTEAGGDLAAAWVETSRCAATDWLCRMQRVRLSERRGDPAGAEQARRVLVAERRRDLIWSSLEPSYLWVWVQLRSPGASSN